MTTLIEREDEKKDLFFPLLETTTESFSNNINLNESSNKQIDKSVEILVENNLFKPITISFYNINYVIGNKTINNKQNFQWKNQIFPFCNSIPMKQILTNVSGIFPPGMNAILGRCIIYFISKFVLLFLFL